MFAVSLDNRSVRHSLFNASCPGRSSAVDGTHTAYQALGIQCALFFLSHSVPHVYRSRRNAYSELFRAGTQLLIEESTLLRIVIRNAIFQCLSRYHPSHDQSNLPPLLAVSRKQAHNALRQEWKPWYAIANTGSPASIGEKYIQNDVGENPPV